MASATNPNPMSKNTGKMIMQQPEPINIADLKPTDCNKMIEVKVYKKWIARNPKKPNPTGLCCILVDHEGNAIQANVAAKDIDFFNRRLQENYAYRISAFSCEPARKWQRAVPHRTSLIFGHATDISIIAKDNFPEYYFNFVGYSELESRADNNDAILTDYIGTIIRVNKTSKKGTATGSTTKWRVIEVQNLESLPINFIIWNEMATKFEEHKYESLEQPVIIAISSCRVTRRHNELQLSATSATRYFLNPNIAEAQEIRSVYANLLGLPPVLPIEHQKFDDTEEEKKRNRYSLKTLLEIDPKHHRYARFTNEATISSINPNQPWYYKKCSECPQKIIEEVPIPRCIDHGAQPIPNYSYCFRATIDDGTGVVTLICFSPESDNLTTECNQIVEQLEDKNPYQLPPNLISLIGTQHIFQFHFTKESELGRATFILDKVLDPKPLAILPPGAQTSQAYAANISEPSTPPTEHHVKIAAKETKITKAQTNTAKRELSFEVNPQEKSETCNKKGKQE